MAENTPPQNPQQSTPAATPNQNDASPKKSQAWKWILGGCIVIVVLGGLGAAGCTYYLAKKSKTLVNELNDYNYNYNYNFSLDEEPFDSTGTNTDDSGSLE